MPRRRIHPDLGLTAVRELAAMPELPDSSDPRLALAVRFLLEDLAVRVPGNSVEVRVPPFGAVQCVPGPSHTRGTPPNVIELDAALWFELAIARISWDDAVATGRLHASGVRADLRDVLPVVSGLN